VVGDTTPLTGGNTIKLYRWLRSSWEPVSNAAEVRVYNEHEDAPTRPPSWHLEVEGGQDALDVEVDDQFSFQAAERRVTFVGSGSVWALRFPPGPAFQTFLQRYNRAAFENRFGLEQTEENLKTQFEGQAGLLFAAETDASRAAWAEDMEADVPSQEELRTPMRKLKQEEKE
jgi:hypothetical protein